MPSNPNFGTGYVDWGSYLAPNADTIARDRSTVQSYLQGQDQGVRAAPPTSGAPPTGIAQPQLNQGAWNAPHLFPFGGPTQTTDGQTAPDWSKYVDLKTNEQALGTPEGFEQVLGAAGGPKGGNSFDAALEGQNASSLYNSKGLDSYLSGLPTASAPAQAAAQRQAFAQPPPMGHDTGNGPPVGAPYMGRPGRPLPEPGETPTNPMTKRPIKQPRPTGVP